jgi:mannose-6-phosphate isomerase-like protein (cupin superfamily)
LKKIKNKQIIILKVVFLEKNMKGFIDNIEKLTLENNNFRKVLYTGRYSQLVLMSLNPGEEIGEEVHGLDQFLRIESGVGKALVGENMYDVSDGFAIVVPAGTKHNVMNTGDAPLKLYTIYSPPNHRDKVLHQTKDEAMKDEEHFDGITTE